MEMKPLTAPEGNVNTDTAPPLEDRTAGTGQSLPEPEEPENNVSAGQGREFALSWGGSKDNAKEDLDQACRMLYMFNVTYTKTVNKAQDIVNQHFNADIPLLSFDRDQSLREHVSQVRETLGTIYQKAELMHNDLLSQLEPSMSAKIEDSNVQMEVEMEVVNELQKTYTGLLGESTPLVAVLLVKKGMVESALPHPARLQDLTVLDLCGNDLLQSTEGVCKALTGGESESDYDRAAQLVWETAEVLWPHFHGYVELIDEVQACIRGEESLDE